ncbi:MAG: GspH/FimT family pseudopilin [Thermoanaerobaculia bacterium]|nr:GspH/FimT family pseudopilin [Thermoanaerobaculia bacterium]
MHEMTKRDERLLERGNRRQDGFSLIEMIVTVGILGILALFTYPSLQRMIVRSQLEGDGRQIVTFMRVARLESIKRSVPVVVEIDLAKARFTAYADLNDALGDPGIDLIYNPVGGAPEGTTDFIVVPEQIMTKNATFGGPAADNLPITGFGVDPGGNPVVVFNSDGSIAAEGTLRFGDVRENYLEISVAPRTTAKVEVLKWDRSAGVWRERATETGGVTWEWYL